MRALSALCLCLILVGCAALRDDMRRAESAFDEARYEDVQVWLSELEPSVAEMDRPMRARFYYLSGMTAFRLEDKRGARHYLALCREEAGSVGLGLRTEWRTNMTATLSRLDDGNPTTSGSAAPVAPAGASPTPSAP